MENEGNRDVAGYDPLQVSLSVFDGPLDLLLQLVRKQSLDINELRLAELTEPYLAHLETMEDLNLDHAGEFLTIASTLILIKSRTLLPRPAGDEELGPEEEEERLLLRLRDYQRIKEAAFELGSLDMLGREIFARHAPSEAPEKSGEEPVFEDVSLFTLIEAFRTVLENTREATAFDVIPERENIQDMISRLLARLSQQKSLFFKDLLSPMASRNEIILAFIAMLELVRLRAIRVFQPVAGGEIHCEVTTAFGSGEVNWSTMIMETIFGSAEGEPLPGVLKN